MEYKLGRAIIVDDLASLELRNAEPAAAAVYDREIGIRLLYEDKQSGEEHYLVRYPAGLKAQLHRHTAAHTIVVLRGRLNANGQIVGPGSYVHFPAGEPMHHAATDEADCLFVILFHAPFDVEILSEQAT
jgi:quercetin dioxygenase-like cupin family protein